MTYSVIIIGAGKIGAFYDSPGSPHVLSHGHAFSSHPGFRLVGFVEPQPDMGRVAAERWGGKAFANLDEAVGASSIDVVVVAVPDEHQSSILNDLRKRSVRLVLVEKPFTRSLEQARLAHEQFSQRNVAMVVNYSRRFLPQFQALRARISREFGRLMRGTAYYGKGSLHNGSHLVNLLIFLLGKLSVRALLDKPLLDYTAEDATGSALLETGEGATVALWAVDSRVVTIFELDLVFEHARVRITNGGRVLEYQSVVSDPAFSGYRIFGPATTVQTELLQALKYSRDNVWDVLQSRQPSMSSVEDALETHRICAELRRE